MSEASAASTTATQAPKSVRYRGPIRALLLLAPFLSEVLSGSTRLSILFVYIPEVMVWGVGALLCRELARRWRAGGTSLLLLGLALSVGEEFLIQQTSIAPLPFAGSNAEYGRIWGVNLVYLLFMLGFESVMVVVVPVEVTELMFPTRSRAPWLRTKGVIACCVFFLLGSRIAWYGWTQQARPRLGAAPYHPPVALLAAGIGLILALAGLAYLLRGVGQASGDGQGGTDLKTAPAWLAGMVAFVAGAGWWAVITQLFIPKPIEPWWPVAVAGVAWAALAYALFKMWSSGPAWRPIERWAAAFGATLGFMVSPYLSVSSWAKADLVAVVIFGMGGIVMFLLLGRKISASQLVSE